MLAAQIQGEHFWSTLQEPVCSTKYPNGYLRLLSALDNDWQIVKVDLYPSWDQTGFIYQITLRQRFLHRTEEFILPMTKIVEEVLERYDLIPCVC